MAAYAIRQTQNELVIEGNGSVDPFLLTRLLRHRPSALLPFTLVRHDGGSRFIFDLRELVSLGHHLRRQGRRASGKRILRKLLEAVLDAEAALLWLEPELLRPGLIFLSRREPEVRLPVLPLAVVPAPGRLLPVLDALFTTDDFPPDLQRALREALSADRFAAALDLIRPPDAPAEPVPSLWQRGRSRLLHVQHALAARLNARPGDRADREFETTQPLDLTETPTIGILSEGMPGTEAEEVGEKAFILVDEFLLGRDSRKVDFYLDDEQCGRVHARILRRRGLFFLEDLGSKNGTYLDGQRLSRYREAMLPEQAKLQFGRLVYFFTRE